MNNKWYCKIGEQEFGPLTAHQVKEMAANGQLLPTHLVRVGDQGPWEKASRLHGATFGSPDHHSDSAPDSWYCKIGSKELGPLAAHQVQQMAERGELLPTDSVRRGIDQEWVPARLLKGANFKQAAAAPKPLNSNPVQPATLPHVSESMKVSDSGSAEETTDKRPLRGTQGNEGEATDAAAMRSKSEALAALEMIAKMIESVRGDKDIQRDNTSLQFATTYGTTSIRIKTVNQAVHDGAVSDVITIQTDLLETFDRLQEPALVATNCLAALGALVRDSAGKVSVVSRVSVFEGDSAAWKLYVPLVAFGSQLQDVALISGLCPPNVPVVQPDLPGRDDPSRWTEEDFSLAANMLNLQGLVTTFSPSGLTSELPNETGAKSAIAGHHNTSLLEFTSKISHPVLGNGLFYKLTLPIPLAEEELPKLSNQLNLTEFTAIDAPPFVGAWCAKSDQGLLSHVGFWPNFMYQSGTVFNLATWQMFRNVQALAALSP